MFAIDAETGAERWRFDHPTTEDFLDTFRPVAGPWFGPLVRETFYGNGTVDYAIDRLSVTEARPFEGYDDRGKRIAAPKVKDHQAKGSVSGTGRAGGVKTSDPARIISGRMPG